MCQQTTAVGGIQYFNACFCPDDDFIVAVVVEIAVIRYDCCCRVQIGNPGNPGIERRSEKLSSIHGNRGCLTDRKHSQSDLVIPGGQIKCIPCRQNFIELGNRHKIDQRPRLRGVGCRTTIQNVMGKEIAIGVSGDFYQADCGVGGFRI